MVAAEGEIYDGVPHAGKEFSVNHLDVPVEEFTL